MDALLLRGHALVTLLFWLQFLVVGTVYNCVVRWRSGTTIHPGPSIHPGRVALETALPLLLLALAWVGWRRRCLLLYLVGSLPVSLIALAWWLHAERMLCGPLPRPGQGAVVSALLYAQLTLLLILGAA